MSDQPRIMLTVTAIVGLLAHPAAAQGPTDTRLAPILRTEQSGAGIVRVVYELNGAAGALFSVALDASSDGGRTFGLSPRAVTGDVGPGVSPGSEKTIVWDSTKDVDDLQADRYVFRVRVTSGGAARPGSAGSTAVTAPGGRAGAPPSTPNSGNTAAAGKRGGLSKGALIAIAGGGAAAGVGVAAAKGGGGTSGSSSTPPANTTPTTTHRNFTANVSSPIAFTFGACVRGEMWTGTVVLSLDLTSTGTVTGSASVNMATQVVSVTASCSPTSPQPGVTGNTGLPLSTVTGMTSRIVFGGNRTQATGGPTVNRIDDWTFTGSLASDVVSGTLAWTVTFTGDGQANSGVGTATFNVTAR